MSGNLHMAWSKLFLEGLAGSGVRWLVVSPGSRSTPLALAALEVPKLSVQVAIDERAAAFFALGVARATGVPAAVLCTSGSAGAHYLPAVVEASEAFVPMVAITADRPWEAHGNGSPQTIDQTRFFGTHARRAFELGLPDADPAALRAVRRIAAQAVATARGPVPGPVQVNAAFRKPLEPVTASLPEPWRDAVNAVAALGPLRAHGTETAPSPEALDHLERRVRRARRGVIVAGPALGFVHDASAVRRLSEQTGFPVLADTTSGLRHGPASTVAIGAYDAFLRAEAFRTIARPDLVLQLGAPPTSPALSAWLAASSGPRVVVAPFGWPDPEDVATDVISCRPGNAVTALSSRLETGGEAVDPEWRGLFAQADLAAWKTIETGRVGALREEEVSRTLVSALPSEAWISVSNSRPVRDLDSFVAPSPRALRVFHQRGASGIDGLIAGAAGISRALATPGALLLGDVAAFHDLSSMALAREAASPLAIVVVDNGGGRIFDELPIAKSDALDVARERLFTTAPRVDFARVADAFGIPCVRADTAGALETALAGAFSRPGVTVVHAVVEIDGVPRERLTRAVATALAGVSGFAAACSRWIS